MYIAGMSDPRNVAHDKKVAQEKEHDQAKPSTSGRPRKKKAKADAGTPADASANAESPVSTPVAPSLQTHEPGELEKSQAVLSKLKEMEFHSRANLETLAGLILTIDDELKQSEFSEPVGQLYAAQDGFQGKVAALVQRYEAKCDSLKQS